MLLSEFIKLATIAGFKKGGSGAAQVASDWNATTGVAAILNKPTLAAVATSGLASDVGLGNVNNTSDANKPVSTPQSTAITNAINALTKASVGLSNVDNTSDVNKPVSTAVQTAINNASSGGTNASKLISANGTPQSVSTGTGTTTTFPLGVINIPANTLTGNNGLLEVTIAFAANVSSSVKTITCTLNSQDLGVSYAMTNLAAGEITIRIQNKNATNAQQVRNSGSPNAAATQTTVDMTAAQTINVLGTLTTSGDTLRITNYTLRASNV